MIKVILLAGGSGTRMNLQIPKQHIVIKNHEIIEYTLTAFSNCELIDSIIVVSNIDYINEVEKFKFKFKKLHMVVAGGATRMESVKKAIEILRNDDDNDKIIISDAARPFITRREIEDIIKSLDNYVAVTTGINSNETILKVEQNEIVQIIQRDGIIRQTSPEGYKLYILKWLYLLSNPEIVKSYRNIGIDQLFASGMKIGIIKSNPLNFKITTQDDLVLFESALKNDFEKIINN